MGSVDGRLLPGRWTAPFDGTPAPALFRIYADLSRELATDAWMFGKSTTAEAFPQRYIPDGSRHAHTGDFYAAPRRSERLFITIDPDADILYDSGTFRGDDMLVILGPGATTGYLDRLRELGISYVVASDPTALRDVMETVYDRFGVRVVSLQGGGVIDGAMLGAGLLDELSLVVYPGIDGLTTAPSIFEYLGASDERPAAGQSLELLAVRQCDYGVIWLRYRFHHSPNPET